MRKALATALACVALAGTVRMTRGVANRAYTAGRSYEDVYYLPPPNWLPVLGLQYRAALADLLWTRALVYFGEELAQGGHVKHVFEYVDAMLALDPDFKAVYRWISTAAIYRPGKVAAADVEHALEYLDRATKRWPDDGEMAWDMGATLRFELPPLLDDPVARREAKLRGAEYLETAARLGAGPPWLPLTTASTLEQQGRTEQAVRHLQEIYASVSDPDTKRQIELRLGRLQGQAYADNLRAAVEAFEAERQADYPYMDPGLFLVLGPKPVHAWNQALADDFVQRHDAPLVDALQSPD